MPLDVPDIIEPKGVADVPNGVAGANAASDNVVRDIDKTPCVIQAKTRFYELFGSVLSAVKRYPSPHASDDALKANSDPAYKVIKARAAAYATAEELADFYRELTRAFTAFFGFEHREDGAFSEEIRQVLAATYMHVIHIVDFFGASGTNEFIDRMKEKQRELRRERAASQFDVNACVADIFGSDETMLHSTFIERSRQITQDVPDFINRGMVEFRDRFKPPKIPKKAFKSALKGIIAQNTKESPEEQELQRAIEMVASLGGRTTTIRDENSKPSKTVESLGGRYDITSFHLFSYLRAGGIPFEDAVSVMKIEPSSFHFSVADSLYNGEHIVDTPIYRSEVAHIEAKTLIHAMYQDDFIEITQLLCNIADGTVAPDEFCLRVGVGGTDTPVPVRIISYIAGSLALAARFNLMYRKTPHIELFTGQEGAIACNRSDTMAVRENTNTVFSLIKEYVCEFFPHLVERFDVVQDIPWTEHARVPCVVDFLEQILLRYSDEDEEMRRIADELARRGNGHGNTHGSTRALKYAAFHIVCFADIPAVTEYVMGRPTSHRHIVSVGGDAERDFTYVRRLLVNHFIDKTTGEDTFVQQFNEYLDDKGLSGFSAGRDSVPLQTRASMITGTGINPPYYLAADGGDIALDEVAGKTADEIMRVIAERVHRALTIVGDSSSDAKIVGQARSFLKGMAILASQASPQRLSDFISRQSAVVSYPPSYD